MNFGKRMGLGVVLMLASCAPARLPPQAPPAAVNGQMTLGRIVAIRPVTVADNTGAAGLNAVLTALNQPAAATPASGTEVVIRQDDGSTIAIAPASAAGFAVGDEVGVVVTDHTTLIHR